MGGVAAPDHVDLFVAKLGLTDKAVSFRQLLTHTHLLRTGSPDGAVTEIDLAIAAVCALIEHATSSRDLVSRTMYELGRLEPTMFEDEAATVLLANGQYLVFPNGKTLTVWDLKETDQDFEVVTLMAWYIAPLWKRAKETFSEPLAQGAEPS